MVLRMLQNWATLLRFTQPIWTSLNSVKIRLFSGSPEHGPLLRPFQPNQASRYLPEMGWPDHGGVLPAGRSWTWRGDGDLAHVRQIQRHHREVTSKLIKSVLIKKVVLRHFPHRRFPRELWWSKICFYLVAPMYLVHTVNQDYLQTKEYLQQPETKPSIPINNNQFINNTQFATNNTNSIIFLKTGKVFKSIFLKVLVTSQKK